MYNPRWNMLPQTQDPAGGGTEDPSKKPPAGTTTPPVAPPAKTPEEEWDAFLAGLPADVRSKLDTHTTGLKSALTSERKTNKENADKLKKLADLETAEQKRKEAEMTEAQKATQKLADLEKELAEKDLKLTTETIKHAVESAAAGMNYQTPAGMTCFQSPEDAYLMADLSNVEIDEDGKVKGVEDVLKALAKAKPYLLKSAGMGAGKGTPRRETQPGKENEQPPEKNRRPIIKF